MRKLLILVLLGGCGGKSQQDVLVVDQKGPSLPSREAGLFQPQPPPVVRCAYSLTAPWAIAGEVLETDAPDACQVSISPGHFWIGVSDHPGTNWAIMDFDQRTHHVGESFMPEVVTVGPDPIYTSFEGALTWLADAPDWRVSFDLTGVVAGPDWNQQHPTTQPVRLVGVMFGNAVATK